MNTICLWSGPRNVSTALMYSFAERDDTRVVDEPLYGHYLRVTGTEHPGRDEVIAAMDCDGDRVMRQLLDRHEPDKDYLFLKQMAHHLVDVDTGFLELTRNIFLIRDPQQMLPSLTIQLPDAGLEDTGLKKQWFLYQQLVDAGQDPGRHRFQGVAARPGGRPPRALQADRHAVHGCHAVVGGRAPG